MTGSIGAAGGEWSRVQRLVFPGPGDRAILPLYVLLEGAVFVEGAAPEGDTAWTRDSVTLSPGASASTATYFGTFPSAYWLAHTPARRVRLNLRVTGPATVRIRATDAAGVVRTVRELDADGEADEVVALDDATAGRIWFDVTAGEKGAVIADAAWSVPGLVASPSTATICITTFNRESDCLQLLRTLSADPGLRDRVSEIVVVDQGDRALQAAAGFDEVAADLGERLRLVEQPNLGGSGGFSRGMLIAADGDATHALVLDDDVVIETESILRMLAFADHADGARVVGAHMLSLIERTLLHSYGERVDRSGFWWEPVASDLSEVDLAARTVIDDPALSRRIDVDFNGWWMCLIPTATIRTVGASLPLFIKWDDAEFGLRAAEAGVPTVTLPGAALWHMPWTAKDDGLDWQAYYQLRNRLVAALIHSPYPRGGRVLRSSLAQDVNHILCLQYGSAAVRLKALSDVLSGPEHLVSTLQDGPAAARALLARFGQVVTSAEGLGRADATPERMPPAGAAATAGRLARVVAHQFTRPRASRVDARQQLPRAEGKWWRLGLLDDATVASATGTGVFVARRDRALAARLARSALMLRLRLWWRWPVLARAYRSATPRLSSRSSWDAVFDAATARVR
jgi:galactofuranosylgalactofuranosylrhamnosyl-N-acetylglucosaminyl-diphospho-decaprenol beta-1,5/1,6-galactofuranosyltransferase